ncbi:MAG: hypothetical protein JXR37_35355 [Kiritimatiellae bacterium]|nr:hypothetical protein [Kiritimatiellia bacterium]
MTPLLVTFYALAQTGGEFGKAAIFGGAALFFFVLWRNILISFGAIGPVRERSRDPAGKDTARVPPAGPEPPRPAVAPPLPRLTRIPSGQRFKIVVKALLTSGLKSLAISVLVMMPGALLSIEMPIVGAVYLVVVSFLMMARTYRRPWRMMWVTCLIPPIASAICFGVQLAIMRVEPHPGAFFGAVALGVLIGILRGLVHRVYVEGRSVFAQRTFGYLLIWLVGYLVTQGFTFFARQDMTAIGCCAGAFSSAMLLAVAVVLLCKYFARRRGLGGGVAPVRAATAALLLGAIGTLVVGQTALSERDGVQRPPDWSGFMREPDGSGGSRPDGGSGDEGIPDEVRELARNAAAVVALILILSGVSVNVALSVAEAVRQAVEQAAAAAAAGPPPPLSDSYGKRLEQQGDRYFWYDRWVTHDEARRLIEQERRERERERAPHLAAHERRREEDWRQLRHRVRDEARVNRMVREGEWDHTNMPAWAREQFPELYQETLRRAWTSEFDRYADQTRIWMERECPDRLGRLDRLLMNAANAGTVTYEDYEAMVALAQETYQWNQYWAASMKADWERITGNQDVMEAVYWEVTKVTASLACPPLAFFVGGTVGAIQSYEAGHTPLQAAENVALSAIFNAAHMFLGPAFFASPGRVLASGGALGALDSFIRSRGDWDSTVHGAKLGVLFSGLGLASRGLHAGGPRPSADLDLNIRIGKGNVRIGLTPPPRAVELPTLHIPKGGTLGGHGFGGDLTAGGRFPGGGARPPALQPHAPAGPGGRPLPQRELWPLGHKDATLQMGRQGPAAAGGGDGGAPPPPPGAPEGGPPAGRVGGGEGGGARGAGGGEPAAAGAAAEGGGGGAAGPPGGGGPIRPLTPKAREVWNATGADAHGRIWDKYGNHIANVDAHGNVTNLAKERVMPLFDGRGDVKLRTGRMDKTGGIVGYEDLHGPPGQDGLPTARQIEHSPTGVPRQAHNVEGPPVTKKVVVDGQEMEVTVPQAHGTGTEFRRQYGPVEGEPPPSATLRRPPMSREASTRHAAARTNHLGEMTGPNDGVIARMDTDGNMTATIDGVEHTVVAFGQPDAGRVPWVKTADGRYWTGSGKLMTASEFRRLHPLAKQAGPQVDVEGQQVVQSAQGAREAGGGTGQENIGGQPSGSAGATPGGVERAAAARSARRSGGGARTPEEIQADLDNARRSESMMRGARHQMKPDDPNRAVLDERIAGRTAEQAKLETEALRGRIQRVGQARAEIRKQGGGQGLDRGLDRSYDEHGRMLDHLQEELDIRNRIEGLRNAEAETRARMQEWGDDEVLQRTLTEQRSQREGLEAELGLRTRPPEIVPPAQPSGPGGHPLAQRPQPADFPDDALAGQLGEPKAGESLWAGDGPEAPSGGGTPPDGGVPPADGGAPPPAAPGGEAPRAAGAGAGEAPAGPDAPVPRAPAPAAERPVPVETRSGPDPYAAAARDHDVGHWRGIEARMEARAADCQRSLEDPNLTDAQRAALRDDMNQALDGADSARARAAQAERAAFERNRPADGDPFQPLEEPAPHPFAHEGAESVPASLEQWDPNECVPQTLQRYLGEPDGQRVLNAAAPYRPPRPDGTLRGVKSGRIPELARDLGLEAQPVRQVARAAGETHFDVLQRHVESGEKAMLGVRYPGNNTGHVVLVEGFDPATGLYTIADPGSGIYRVTQAQLSRYVQWGGTHLLRRI